jgi:hypothetical protein
MLLTATPAPTDDTMFRFRLPNVVSQTQEWQLNQKVIRETNTPGQYVIKIPKGVSQLVLAKYKVDPKILNGKPPLLLLPQWNIAPNGAKLIARYKVNHKFISPQTEVSFLAQIDPENTVVACSSHEPANTMRYNAPKQKCLWTLPLPQLDGALSVTMSTKSAIQPQPMLVNFACDSVLMSGLEIDSETDHALNSSSNCRLLQVVKRIKAGTFSASV